MEIASVLIEEVSDIVLRGATRQLGYITGYKRNVNELKDCVWELKHAKERVQHQVDEAENNGQVIEADVQHWLIEVDKKIIENETFYEDKRHGKTDCFMGLLPHLSFRHQLGRKAKKMTLDVKLLLGKSKFDRVFIKKDRTSMNVALSNFDYVSFKSQTEVMGRIKGALTDPNVRMIGVFGPGGVGKTTLVKEVAKEAKKDNLFNVVVMVNVTRDPNLMEIQSQIAEMLGFKLAEESEIVRADRLRKRLKNEKNILIILDDLWEGLDLNKLGISFDDDDNFSHMTGGKDKQNSDSNEMKKEKSSPGKDKQNSDSNEIKKEESSSNYKECKILLTSRIEEVLSTQMDVKKESIFSVGLLEENEAKTLFKKLVAKVPEKNSEFEKLMDEIIKKCDCLPMAIIAVGKALRNKSHTEWKEALEQLNRHESMEQSIKLSYDHLESEELKLTFLLCAQMGPHPLVMDLVKYCVGLDILEGVHTIKEAHNRIDRSIQKFKDVGLLLNSDSSDYLNMHDIVRIAALSIASKEQNIFTLRNGKLDEWLDKDKLKSCTYISLHNCDIVDGLPDSINCPQLKVFHIDNVDPSIRIPNNFFKGMRKLRVLILNGFHIPQFPSSIKYLTDLRMLCMERCVLGDNLFKIGELKKLRIMILSGSEFEELSREIRQLVNLQWLDISNCSKLKSVCDALYEVNLERFSCPYIIKSMGIVHSRNVFPKLESLCLYELENMEKLFYNPLTDDSLCNLNTIKIQNCSQLKFLFSFDLVRLLNKLEIVEVSNSNSLEEIVAGKIQKSSDTNVKDDKIKFLQLRSLALRTLPNFIGFYANDEMISISQSMERRVPINELDEITKEEKHAISLFSEQVLIPNVESLELSAINIHKIWGYQPSSSFFFQKLTKLNVNQCNRLKYLFSFSVAKNLENLKDLSVSDCEMMEDIFYPENVSTNEVKAIIFPKLENIQIFSMMKLSTIWHSQACSEGSFCNLNSVLIQSCGQLVTVFPSHMIGILKNLVILRVSSCDSVKAIFDLEDTLQTNVDGDETKLQRILLMFLPNLKLVLSRDPKGILNFKNLQAIKVNGCPRLQHILPVSVAKDIQKLKSLEVSNCGELEKIVA